MRWGARGAFTLGVTWLTGTAVGQVAGRVSILERDNRPSRDLGDAVAWLDGASSPAAPDTFEIVISEKVYAPRVLVVPRGSTVRFPNHDPFDHNVFAAGEQAFDLGLFGRGQTRSHTFERAGLARIFCNIHPRMVAFVVVMPASLYAQPAADGTFRIDSVPPGAYRLHVWHERAAEVVQEVTVGPEDATDIRVTLDARRYRFQQHRNKFGNPYPANAGRERY